MARARPTWTDNVSVIAAAALALGSTTRGTLDLRTKYGAYLFLRIGRGGTTALTNGVSVLARRLINNDAAGGAHPVDIELLGSYAAASSTTVASDSASGQATLNVASVSGFVAGDLVCIQDSGGGVTRLEWHRVAKTATGILTLDRPLQYTHTAGQADTVRNKADVFPPQWINGGALYEIVFDYGDDSAGESVTVQALAQTLDDQLVSNS